MESEEWRVELWTKFRKRNFSDLSYNALHSMLDVSFFVSFLHKVESGVVDEIPQAEFLKYKNDALRFLLDVNFLVSLQKRVFLKIINKQR